MLDPLDHSLILDALQDPVSVLQPDGRIAYVNPAAARLLGRPVADLQGVSIWDLYPEAIRSRFYEHFRSALEERAERHVRIHWASPNVWLDFRFLPCRTGIIVLTRNVTDEQRLQSALAENEERLRLAQQAAGVGTWDWNQATGQVNWSDGIWRMMGLEPGAIEPSVEAWNASIHPEDRERACRRSAEVLASGEGYEEEFRIVQPDGRSIWIVCLGRVIRNAEGQAIRFLGVNLDITRRKEAEQRLAESEARYRFITEALPQVIWMVGADGAQLECNRHWYEFTGLTPSEMRDGFGMQQVVHPDDLAQINGKWADYLAEGQEYQFEYRIRRAADGAYRWHFGRAMPIRDAAGTLVRWLGTAFDIQQLKDAAEAVQRSDELHRAMIEQAGEGFWLTDQGGRCLEVNHAACEILGYAREELLGTVVREFFHPEDEPDRAKALRQVHRGQTVRAEYRLRRKDGTYVLTEGAARSFQGNTIVFFHDITQRRAAEEALRVREQEFRAIFEMAAVGAAQAEPESGRFTRVNERLCEILGYTADELLNRSFQSVTHPEDRETDARVIGEVLAGAKDTWELQKRYLRKDGGIIWGQVSGTILRGPDGRPERTLVMVQDVTDAHRAHEALVESERALREAQRIARLGTWSVDFRTGQVWWSEELFRLYQLDPHTVAPTLDAVRSVLDPEDWSKVDAQITASRERGEGFHNLELRVIRPDGTVRWLLAQGEVEPDAQGDPMRLVGSCLDITERKLLEAQVEERARALAEESRRKDEFLAMLAHELRNPLAPVMTAVHVLKLRGDDPAFASRQREIIERNARHLSRLVDDLLEVSRINEGKIELRKEQVALRGVIQQAATSVQHSLQARRHELRVSVPPEEIYLEADPVRIVQILVNLLNNAVKYTDEGGQIELLAAVNGTEVMMRVRDNGRGIDPELLPRIFDLFVQGERTLARSDGGLGLGLTLTRTLAQLHGGSVTVTSAGLQQGSEFTVRLPIAAH